MTGNVLYHETQRWRDVWWVMALVFGLAAIQWWIFFVQIVQGIPVGNNPGSDALVIVIWIIFGIGFPVFFLLLKMVVEVVPGAIIIVFRPFVNRRILMGEIAHLEPKVYRPLREYGGWGVRGIGGRIAYNVRGNAGVELTLIDGRRVMIGTQHPGELAEAIYKSWSGSK
ncbi:MAG: hypothetical protein DCC51_01845 [Anaerolineae bacterium]|nr:MAG: hypothetical protein DCC51_01845 [Anaerolineae bacterium]